MMKNVRGLPFDNVPAEVVRPADPLETIRRFAALRSDDPWNPEDCIEHWRLRGYSFEDQRNWGSHFRIAADVGIIRPAGMFKRKSSNGSKRPGWVRGLAPLTVR